MKIRTTNIDIERTKLLHETGGMIDRDSYVTFSGKFFLAGDDMTQRRREVWERDERRCVLCGALVSFERFEMDHFPSKRSDGGDDKMENLRTLCGTPCHRGKVGVHA